MRRTIILSVAALLLMFSVPTAAQEQARTAEAVSWDNFRAAKAMAESCDREGKFVEALQHYLEYIKQAEGLGEPALTAWGKNNAAYMIIKHHKADPSVDLGPARKLIEEGLAIEAAPEDCRKALASNMGYVDFFSRK